MSESRPRAHRAARVRVTGIARHGRLGKTRPFGTLLKLAAAAVAVVLVSGASVAAITFAKFDSNIKTVTLTNETEGPPPKIGAFDGGFNALVVGSDVCEDGSGCHGRGSAELNDVTLLLHVSQDQSNAVAVSIPRDMVVPIPSCPHKDGKGKFPAMSAQPINNTLSYGGLPCTVLTVETLTGLTIPFAAEVKFSGVVNITNAIGGVPVCVDGPINDRYSGFKVPKAGEYTLSGESALAFLRTRHGVGDGSDLGRISGQQMFLASLVRTIKRPEVLGNFSTLFKIATVVSENTILSNSLKNPTTMVAMARVLKNLQLDRVMFVQYPGVTGGTGVYQGKVQPVTSAAKALFAKIKADQPFSLTPGNTGLGTKVAADTVGGTTAQPVPSATATAVPSASTSADPTMPGVVEDVHGQSAAENTCAKHNN